MKTNRGFTKRSWVLRTKLPTPEERPKRRSWASSSWKRRNSCSRIPMKTWGSRPKRDSRSYRRYRINWPLLCQSWRSVSSRCRILRLIHRRRENSSSKRLLRFSQILNSVWKRFLSLRSPTHSLRSLNLNTPHSKRSKSDQKRSVSSSKKQQKLAKWQTNLRWTQSTKPCSTKTTS